MNWKHKDEWTCRDNQTYLVKVSRHEERVYADDPDQGKNRWCIYIFVYPKHPRFDELLLCDDMGDVPSDIPLHGGCSYYSQHIDKTRVTSIQIGCDYNHLHDGHYTFMDTKEQAESIFQDAEQLYKQFTL